MSVDCKERMKSGRESCKEEVKGVGEMVMLMKSEQGKAFAKLGG